MLRYIKSCPQTPFHSTPVITEDFEGSETCTGQKRQDTRRLPRERDVVYWSSIWISTQGGCGGRRSQWIYSAQIFYSNYVLGLVFWSCMLCPPRRQSCNWILISRSLHSHRSPHGQLQDDSFNAWCIFTFCDKEAPWGKLLIAFVNEYFKSLNSLTRSYTFLHVEGAGSIPLNKFTPLSLPSKRGLILSNAECRPLPSTPTGFEGIQHLTGCVQLDQTWNWALFTLL